MSVLRYTIQMIKSIRQWSKSRPGHLDHPRRTLITQPNTHEGNIKRWQEVSTGRALNATMSCLSAIFYNNMYLWDSRRAVLKQSAVLVFLTRPCPSTAPPEENDRNKTFLLSTTWWTSIIRWGIPAPGRGSSCRNLSDAMIQLSSWLYPWLEIQ